MSLASRAARRSRLFAAALPLALALGACDNDSPTAPPRPTPTPAPLEATFTPSYAGQAESVALQLGDVPPYALALELWVHELPPVDGIFFDLVYPPDLLDYVGFLPDDFLSVTSFGQPNREEGRLRVHAGSLGFAPYPATGTGRVLGILFTPLRTGTGELRFEGYGIVTYPGGKMRYGRLSWFGGQVTVVQP